MAKSKLEKLVWAFEELRDELVPRPGAQDVAALQVRQQIRGVHRGAGDPVWSTGEETGRATQGLL